jgi:hypothetical protein
LGAQILLVILTARLLLFSFFMEGFVGFLNARSQCRQYILYYAGIAGIKFWRIVDICAGNNNRLSELLS